MGNRPTRNKHASHFTSKSVSLCFEQIFRYTSICSISALSTYTGIVSF